MTLHLSIGVANAMGCDVTAPIDVAVVFAPNDVDAPASIDSYCRPAIEIVPTTNVFHGDDRVWWRRHVDLAQLLIVRAVMASNLCHCPVNDFVIVRVYYLKTCAAERHAICASSYAASYFPVRIKVVGEKRKEEKTKENKSIKCVQQIVLIVI